MSLRGWLHRGAAAALALGALALVASAFIGGATPDEEEFRNAVVTTWLHARALADGSYAFWTPLLGFGVPQPLVAHFWFHPLLPLLAIMSPVDWMRLLLVTQTAFGAAGVWWLCRTLDLKPIVAGVCVATFLLAAPSQNYLMADFWPSSWIGLTMVPWVLLAAWKVLDAPRSRARVWSAVLGLLAGLAVAHSNPGNIVVHGVLVPALLVVRWRRGWARRWHLVRAAVIAAAVLAPTAVHLVAERRVYVGEIARSYDRVPLPPSAAWDAFLRPLSASDQPWKEDVAARGVRTLFFGGPFAVLCLVAVARRGWQRPELALAAGLAGVALFAGAVPALGASDRYYFRDPLILCGTLLAGMAADRGLRARRWRPVTAALLAAQPIVLGLAALPIVERTWDEGREGAVRFRGATGGGQAADAIVASIAGRPGRVLFSPRVDEQVRERGLLADGLGVNALAFRGVPVVNAWLVGVSADPIWPDERLFYSRIRPPRALLESDATLDALGIRYVLAAPDEPVAGDLRKRRDLSTSRIELTLYENANAWPGAFLSDASWERQSTPVFAGCENDRLLCHDLSELAAQARHAGVTRRDRPGAIDVSLEPLDAPAVLVITEMYRPEWRASADGAPLETMPFAGALIGVRVPPGVGVINLVFRPWPMIAATVVAWSAVLAAVGVMGAMFLRRFVGRAAPPSEQDRSWLREKLADARRTAKAREESVGRWKDAASRNHRRMLSRHVIHGLLERRIASLPARTAIPGAAEREAALRAVSPAYVAASASSPASFGGHAYRMTVQGLNWWMPVLRPRPEGPSADWLRKQRFPYLALAQTRELSLGGVMLDLGANTGRMSIPRVILGDVVTAYCAEPDPLNYACLVGNIVENGLAGLLMPDQVAISDREGTITLSRGKYSGGHRVLADSSVTEQKGRELIEVPCVTVDAWLARLKVNPDAVTFVKVDVQGFETRVLDGAADLLARRQAAWQLEIEPQLLTVAGSSLEALFERLRRHFTRFIDLKADLTGPRDRPIDEIAEALSYLGKDEHKTDVLVF